MYVLKGYATLMALVLVAVHLLGGTEFLFLGERHWISHHLQLVLFKNVVDPFFHRDLVFALFIFFLSLGLLLFGVRFQVWLLEQVAANVFV